MSGPLQRFRSEFPDVANALDRQQWTALIARSGHIKVRTEKGRLVATLAGSPSDTRSWKNAIADMKRAGLDLTPVVLDEYVAPKDTWQFSNGDVVTLNTPVDPLDTYDATMTYKHIMAALDLDQRQVTDAAKSGLLGTPLRQSDSNALWFRRDDVRAFRGAGYRELYPKRRTYTRRTKLDPPEFGGAKDWDSLPEAPPLVAAPTIRLTRPELTDIVRSAVLTALREYHRER